MQFDIVFATIDNIMALSDRLCSKSSSDYLWKQGSRFSDDCNEIGCKHVMSLSSQRDLKTDIYRHYINNKITSLVSMESILSKVFLYLFLHCSWIQPYHWNNNIFCFWFQSTRFRISSDCGSLSNWRHCSDLFSVLHKVSISLITISTSSLPKWSYNYQETPGLCEETSFRCWSDCKQPENSLYSIWRSSVQFICFTIRTESE